MCCFTKSTVHLMKLHYILHIAYNVRWYIKEKALPLLSLLFGSGVEALKACQDNVAIMSLSLSI